MDIILEYILGDQLYVISSRGKLK